jgi:cell division protein FtsI (penicillin-binding protein 3)
MLVSGSTDSEGVIHRIAPDEGRRVVSEQTAQQLNLMLRNVVMEGTGTLATVPGYTSAGKTGTPWKAIDGGYTDSSGRYHYQPNFVGFVPAQDPQLSVLVMIDDPTAGPYTGGDVAAPVFSKIASFALQLLGIPAPTTDVAGGGGAVAGGEGSDEPQGAALPVGVTRDENGRVRGLPAQVTPPRPAPVEHTTSTTSANH